MVFVGWQRKRRSTKEEKGNCPQMAGTHKKRDRKESILAIIEEQEATGRGLVDGRVGLRVYKWDGVPCLIPNEEVSPLRKARSTVNEFDITAYIDPVHPSMADKLANSGFKL